MIIVEGLDGSGKTTLVKHLYEELKLNLRPRFSTSLGGPHEDLFDLVRKDFEHGVGVDHLYDRHPIISEIVYGSIIRGKFDSRLIGEEMQNWLREANPLLVMCAPPGKEMVKNIMEGDHMPGVKENIVPLMNGYSVAMLSWNYPMIHWDYINHDIEDLTVKVMDYVHRFTR